MSTWERVHAEHVRVIEGLRDAGTVIDQMVERIVGCFRVGGKVLTIGNGGSAADAQHIAAELLGRFKQDRQALPALALTTDSSTVTAIGNDLGYERVFERQLQALLQKDDILWALSTSGNSPNVLGAARLARERGAVVIGFVGESGGDLAALCDHVLRVPARTSERIQEGHLLAYHYVCERVEAAFA